MPLSPTGISALCSAQWLATLPLSIFAKRDNPEMGIPPHNPGLLMMQSFAKGWANTLLMIPLSDAFVGTSGIAATPAPMPILFTSPIPVQSALLSAELGWAGPKSFLVANLLLSAPVIATIATGIVMFPPLPGGGSGASILNKATCPALLRTSSKELFVTNITAAFLSTGKFHIGDIVLSPLTVQLLGVIRSVAKYYAIVLESLMLQIPYVGPTGPSPFAFSNQGKFV